MLYLHADGTYSLSILGGRSSAPAMADDAAKALAEAQDHAARLQAQADAAAVAVEAATAARAAIRRRS